MDIARVKACQAALRALAEDVNNYDTVVSCAFDRWVEFAQAETHSDLSRLRVDDTMCNAGTVTLAAHALAKYLETLMIENEPPRLLPGPSVRAADVECNSDDECETVP